MTVRLYERKKDAEFVAVRLSKGVKETVNIQKIQVTDEQAARDIGMEICPDLGIASHSPKQGETGWIVMRGGLGRARKEYRPALRFLKE